MEVQVNRSMKVKRKSFSVFQIWCWKLCVCLLYIMIKVVISYRGEISLMFNFRIVVYSEKKKIKKWRLREQFYRYLNIYNIRESRININSII